MCCVCGSPQVLPELPITDYLTQWSGITKALLEGCTNSLHDARERAATHPAARACARTVCAMLFLKEWRTLLLRSTIKSICCSPQFAIVLGCSSVY